MIPVRQILATPGVLAITSRIRQDSANPDEVAPYLVWRRNVVPENHLSGPPLGDLESIRVDVFAANEAQRDALTVAVRDALEAHGHVNNIQSLGRDVDVPSLWRFSIDADLFHNR